MDPLWYKAIIVLLAGIGLGIAWYIHHTKKRNETLVCPLHANCETVVHSAYAQFVGLPVELLGIAYYAIVAVVYLALLAIPALNIPVVILLSTTLTVGACIFSVYLTIVQMFLLRAWCSWCLVSAVMCLLIVTIVIAGLPMDLLSLLTHSRFLIVLLHGLVVVLGFGSAMVADILFFKFLKDLRISAPEGDVLGIVSHLVWAAVGLIVITGLGLFLPDSERLLATPKFVVKMVVVLVIIMNGVILHFVVRPQLQSLFFGVLATEREKQSRRMRRIAFACGAISSSSWLTAFVLGSVPALPLPLPMLLAGYGAIVVMAVIGSQGMEYLLSHRDA